MRGRRRLPMAAQLKTARAVVPSDEDFSTFVRMPADVPAAVDGLRPGVVELMMDCLSVRVD